MTYGDTNTQRYTVIVDMDDTPADASSMHAGDAVLPDIPPVPAQNLGGTNDLLEFGGAWSLKRSRSSSPDHAVVYQSLPTSPKATLASRSLETEGVQGVATEVDFDAGLATGTVDEATDGYQRAHSQLFTFQHDEESGLGPPAKKRRLFQHEHALDLGDGQENFGQVPGAHDHEAEHHAVDDEQGEHDDITAQLMASLQQAAEGTDFAEGQQPDPEAGAGDAPVGEGGATEVTEEEPPIPDEAQPEQLDITLQAQSEQHEPEHHEQHEPEHHEQHAQEHQDHSSPEHQEQTENQECQPQIDFSHDDLLDAFIGASAAASPVPANNGDLSEQPLANEERADTPIQETAPTPKNPTSAPPNAQTSSSPIVIDPSLARMSPNPVRSSHPLSAAPVPVIPVPVANSRPVPTNPLAAINGPTRPSSAGLTSHSPSTTGPRPVVLAPNQHRPLPKKPPRDYTPARPGDKRRPTPRRGGRDAIDPYQPPLASSIGYQTNVVVKNGNSRSTNIDDANLAATLSPETLTVLEAAATTLSQIQGPITQEHLEGIVCEFCKRSMWLG